MNVPNIPVWLAYILAPVFILLCAMPVMIRSESPVVLAAASIGCGLLCAATLHAYVAVKRRFVRGMRHDQDEEQRS